MNELNIENAITMKNIIVGLITVGIVPLMNGVYKIYQANAPEREKRREFRLRKYEIKMRNKRGVTK